MHLVVRLNSEVPKGWVAFGGVGTWNMTILIFYNK